MIVQERPKEMFRCCIENPLPSFNGYPYFKRDFVDATLVNGEVNDLIMSKYALYVGDNKWRIDKSFIDLTKLENKLNVKFKIIQDA
jgi:hypothetical protein